MACCTSEMISWAERGLFALILWNRGFRLMKDRIPGRREWDLVKTLMENVVLDDSFESSDRSLLWIQGDHGFLTHLPNLDGFPDSLGFAIASGGVFV